MTQTVKTPFIKMHGLGNDFVIFDARVKDISLSKAQIQGIADRKHGVGCDQLIIIERSQNFLETNFMRIFNADGSEAEACGNATRCVADILMQEDGVDQMVVETLNGALNCSRVSGDLKEELIRVEMGVPKLEWRDIPLSRECDTLHLPLKVAGLGAPVGVNVGNPHCVFFVDNIDRDWDDVAVEAVGHQVLIDPLFPKQTNVEFAQILAPDHIRMRVRERGVGVTAACGSGACGTVVAAIRRGLTGRSVRVTLDGGDLIIDWLEDTAPIAITGPVAYVFEGTVLL